MKLLQFKKEPAIEFLPLKKPEKRVSWEPIDGSTLENSVNKLETSFDKNNEAGLGPKLYPPKAFKRRQTGNSDFLELKLVSSVVSRSDAEATGTLNRLSP